MSLPSRSAPPSHPGREGPPEWDPVFLHSRREAIVIFCIWLAGLLWAVPYCYLNGYASNVDAADISTIWGIPAWLFWGIAVPWVVVDVLTAWFCFGYMQDDDLGAATENLDEAAAGTAEPMKSRGPSQREADQ